MSCLPSSHPILCREALSVTASCMQVGPDSTPTAAPGWVLPALGSSAVLSLQLSHRIHPQTWTCEGVNPLWPPWTMGDERQWVKPPLPHPLPHPRVASQRSPAGDGLQRALSSCPFLFSLVPVSGPDPPNVPTCPPASSQVWADPKAARRFCQFRAARVTKQDNAIRHFASETPRAFILSLLVQPATWRVPSRGLCLPSPALVMAVLNISW